jgi:hypothetical protein
VILGDMDCLWILSLSLGRGRMSHTVWLVVVHEWEAAPV